MRSLWMILLALALGLAGCKFKHTVTTLEVTVDEATVWDSNQANASIIKKLPRGTRITTRQPPSEQPGFYVVKTDNGEGIIRAPDVSVVQDK